MYVPVLHSYASVSNLCAFITHLYASISIHVMLLCIHMKSMSEPYKSVVFLTIRSVKF